MTYGLDIKTPTTVPGHDGWEPVLETAERRVMFENVEALCRYEATLKKYNPQLQIRIVEIHEDPNQYRL